MNESINQRKYPLIWCFLNKFSETPATSIHVQKAMPLRPDINCSLLMLVPMNWNSADQHKNCTCKVWPLLTISKQMNCHNNITTIFCSMTTHAGKQHQSNLENYALWLLKWRSCQSSNTLIWTISFTSGSSNSNKSRHANMQYYTNSWIYRLFTCISEYSQ